MINYDFARSKCNVMKQEDHETVSQYYVGLRLRQQAIKCNFRDVDDTSHRVSTELL